MWDCSESDEDFVDPIKSASAQDGDDPALTLPAAPPKQSKKKSVKKSVKTIQ